MSPADAVSVAVDNSAASVEDSAAVAVVFSVASFSVSAGATGVSVDAESFLGSSFFQSARR